MLAHTVSTNYGTSVALYIALYSKDLFTSLSTQRNSHDKSIRADVNFIRFELERRNVSCFIWIPREENLADPGTKSDSPLENAPRLTLFDGRLSLDFFTLERCSAHRPLG